MSEVADKPRSRRVVWVVGAAVAVAALAGAGWYGWLWITTPAPPDVSLDGAEAEVVQAVNAARDKVRRNGRSGAAWGELGQVLIAHDYAEAADACFAQAERFDPTNPRWPYYQGLHRTGPSPDASIAFLRRAAELCDKYDKANDAPRLLLAELLTQTATYDDADRQLHAVLQLNPDSPRAHYDLGMLALARQDDAGAEQQLSVSAKSPYTRRKSNAALAAIHKRQGKPDSVDFDREAASGPPDRSWDDPYLDEYLARQVVRRGRLAEAERLEAEGLKDDALALLKKLAEDPLDARAKIGAGILLYEMKRLDEAERYFRDAVGLESDQAEAHYFLCLVLFTQGERLEGSSKAEERTAAPAKYREAVDHAERTLALKPNHTKAYLYKGLALKKLNQKQEAIEALRQAVRCGPDLVDTHLKLGQALAEDGRRRDEAIAELQLAVQVAPAGDSRAQAALDQLRGDKPK